MRQIILYLVAALVGCVTVGSSQTSTGGPGLQLRAGENYFRSDGVPVFVLGRNPAGKTVHDFDQHFRYIAAAGERFVRIHFTFFPQGEKPGEIDPNVLKSWDTILDAAEGQGLAVLPVLGLWVDWNDGSRNEIWHAWDRNPFNAARGGPAKRPAELFDDTPCRRLWLGRLEKFVTHWSGRRAIVGWEIFSELDLVTGADEERASLFAERAAAVIKRADPWKRPVTASDTTMREWPKLLGSPSLDFNEIHPYANGVGGRLDDLIISTVRNGLRRYGKPVLLGECGLDARPPRGTLDVAPRAEIGIRHAIWASVVSGAMNGRMLWWQDGYDLFEKAEICRHYDQAAATAAAFVRGVDFTGFAPVACVLSHEVKGAVIGNDWERLGWFRDVACDPPDWPMKPIREQTVSMDAPGDSWQVEFVDPVTGRTTGESRLAVSGGRLQIVLPEFQGSIAIRMKRIRGR